MRVLTGAQLRIALGFGTLSAAGGWAVFLLTGGIAGARGELPPAAAFLIGAIAAGWAGYTLRRQGGTTAGAALAGLGTGMLAAILYDLPHSIMLLLGRGYMTWLQTVPHAERLGRFGPNLGYLHGIALFSAGTMPPLPWWGLRILAAVAGSGIAGVFLGAACGSIGGSLAAEAEKVAA